MQEICAVGFFLLINSTAALVCGKQGVAMFHISNKLFGTILNLFKYTYISIVFK